MKRFALAALALLAFSVSVHASTWMAPRNGPRFLIDIPNSWNPQSTDEGFHCQSPDGGATLLFETATPKNLDALYAQNWRWLTQKHHVEINKSTLRMKNFMSPHHLQWHKKIWDATSKHWGHLTVMFAFIGVPHGGRVLLVTYCVPKQTEKYYHGSLVNILDSIRWAPH